MEEECVDWDVLVAVLDDVDRVDDDVELVVGRVAVLVLVVVRVMVTVVVRMVLVVADDELVGKGLLTVENMGGGQAVFGGHQTKVGTLDVIARLR